MQGGGGGDGTLGSDAGKGAPSPSFKELCAHLLGPTLPPVLFSPQGRR